VKNGKLNGDHITFAIGDTEYSGRVSGDAMQGSGWTATRTK
jgi:hypothetical protein